MLSRRDRLQTSVVLLGGQPKEFLYDENSFGEHVYWLMAQNGFLEVACEPNCVFQICNQPAILGFRLHDMIHGGSRAEEVVRGYEAAWADFGRVDENGYFFVMIAETRMWYGRTVSVLLG